MTSFISSRGKKQKRQNLQSKKMELPNPAVIISSSLLRFQKLCERAFLLLRKKGPLFINLFTMMLSTGIPELRTVDDIHYIRNALCLGKTEEQALEDFKKKMQEARKHSFSVSMNWFLHNVAHA